MGRKILFTPIGTTDPVTNFKDGSMLHICRVYQPDVVYLYLSAEMIKFHERDNRYEYCIKKLAEKLDHNIEIKYIMRPDLHNVQIYDLYYEDFCEIIPQIQKEMSSKDELLINVASGTPAMKSALMILAALSEYRIQPIQVTTPVRKSNRRDEDIEKYDVATYWELNEDNESEFENRCVEVKNKNLMALMKLENVYRFVRSYDYAAALVMAEQIKPWISEQAYLYLELANARIQLDNKKVDSILAKLKQDIIPVKSGDQRSVFEYALSLGIKLKKKEYADFLRALTPLTSELTESILKVQCKINIEDYCVKKKGVKWLDLNKLKGTDIELAIKEEFRELKSVFVGTRQIVPLIIHFSEDQVLCRQAKDIMEIEQKVRNLAAHEIVSVTEDWIQQRTDFKPEKIYNIIKYLVVKSGIKVPDDYWSSYDSMNERIIEELKII